MEREPGTPLGQALLAWMKRRRAGPMHIQRHGGVSRNTVVAILEGTTTDPRPETLRGLARGIAAEPYSPYDRDDLIAASCYRDLHIAAGYGDVMADGPDSFLEMGLLYTVGTESRAAAWRRFIERHRHLEPGEIEALDTGPDPHDRTGLSTE